MFKMLNYFFLILCLQFVVEIHCDERKMMSILDDQMICGPVTCPVNLTAMCFTTNRLTKDSNNGSYITSCGTCLAADGSTVRESCGTEPTTLTNFINSMSISLLNSTVDQTRFRNGVTGLLMSEMASGSPPSAIPSVQVNPIPSIPTPNAYTPQPPVIVVQPPAQQIYFNQPSTGSDYGYSYDTSRPERSPNDMCTPPNSPECVRSSQTFQPNGLPPQLDKVYNDIRTMHQTLNRVQSTIQDMAAGLPIGYLETPKDARKQHFPVFTPPAFL